MATIKIPFLKRWRTLMLDGIKTHTCRSIAYGEAGDRFEIFGGVFELVRVFQARVGDVAEFYYQVEGCKSSAEFIEIWEELHPGRGYRSDDIRWLHHFKRVA